MNTPISLQVKAYLLPETVKVTARTINLATEIRRFVLVHPWTGSYDELVRKVVQSFGENIKAEDASALSLYWQDEEGELIGFSSDHEMKYANDLLVALQASSNGVQTPHVFKIYIGRKFKTPQAPAPSQVVNYGVNCDGCNMSDFVGLRFKCQTCPDYDLCSTCESKGIHKETGHTFTTIEGGRGGCPRRDQWGFMPGMRGGCHRRGRGAPHYPHPHPQPGVSGFPGNLFGDLGQFLPTTNNEELKQFGQHLKSLLEPFGVDVDYFVDNLSSATSENKPEAKKEEKKDAAGPAPAATPAPTVQPTASTSAAAAATTDVVMEEPSTTPKTPLPEDATMPKMPAAPEQNSNVTAPNENARVDNPFLQVINMMKDFSNAKNTETANATTPKTSLNTTATSAPAEDSFVTLDTEMEKEIKIIRAIDQLKSMGYTDDSGWLMRLVIAKEGNINAVLDAIQPK